MNAVVRWLKMVALFAFAGTLAGHARADLVGMITSSSPSYYIAPGAIVDLGTSTFSTTMSADPVVSATRAGSVALPPGLYPTPVVEVLFLTDTTGSMRSTATGGNGGLAALQAAVAFGGGVMTSIEGANPGTSFRWAVADYHDFIGDDFYNPAPYVVQSGFGTAAAAEAAMASYGNPAPTVGGGLPGQEPEQQYSALVALADGWQTVLGGSALGTSERIIVWTGDSAANEGVIVYPGPQPETYPTTFNTFTALREASISVYGMNVAPAGGGIDSPGSLGFAQASTLGRATGGTVTNLITSLAASTFNGTISSTVGSAISNMNNITVHADPADLGPWNVAFFERTTRLPFSGTYPFEFDYGPPTFFAPFGLSPGNPFGFPAGWAAITPASFLDSWNVRVEAPLFADTRVVMFEVRVDGVLVDMIDVTLTNETASNLAIPEPASVTCWMLLLGGGYWSVVRTRRRGIRQK